MNTKQSQTNTFAGGINMDTHPLTTPENILTDCVNGTLITYNGNEFVLQNDMGNVLVHKTSYLENYVPMAAKEHNGIIYIVSYNPISKETQIGTYPSPLVDDKLTYESTYSTSTDINLGGKISEFKFPMQILSDSDIHKVNPLDNIYVNIEGDIPNIYDIDYFIFNDGEYIPINLKQNKENQTLPSNIGGLLAFKWKIFTFDKFDLMDNLSQNDYYNNINSQHKDLSITWSLLDGTWSKDKDFDIYIRNELILVGSVETNLLGDKFSWEKVQDGIVRGTFIDKLDKQVREYTSKLPKLNFAEWEGYKWNSETGILSKGENTYHTLKIISTPVVVCDNEEYIYDDLQKISSYTLNSIENSWDPLVKYTYKVCNNEGSPLELESIFSNEQSGYTLIESTFKLSNFTKGIKLEDNVTKITVTVAKVYDTYSDDIKTLDIEDFKIYDIDFDVYCDVSFKLEHKDFPTEEVYLLKYNFICDKSENPTEPAFLQSRVVGMDTIYVNGISAENGKIVMWQNKYIAIIQTGTKIKVTIQNDQNNQENNPKLTVKWGDTEIKLGESNNINYFYKDKDGSILEYSSIEKGSNTFVICFGSLIGNNKLGDLKLYSSETKDGINIDTELITIQLTSSKINTTDVSGTYSYHSYFINSIFFNKQTSNRFDLLHFDDWFDEDFISIDLEYECKKLYDKKIFNSSSNVSRNLNEEHIADLDSFAFNYDYYFEEGDVEDVEDKKVVKSENYPSVTTVRYYKPEVTVTVTYKVDDKNLSNPIGIWKDILVETLPNDIFLSTSKYLSSNTNNIANDVLIQSFKEYIKFSINNTPTEKNYKRKYLIETIEDKYKTLSTNDYRNTKGEYPFKFNLAGAKAYSTINSVNFAGANVGFLVFNGQVLFNNGVNYLECDVYNEYSPSPLYPIDSFCSPTGLVLPKINGYSPVYKGVYDKNCSLNFLEELNGKLGSIHKLGIQYIEGTYCLPFFGEFVGTTSRFLGWGKYTNEDNTIEPSLFVPVCYNFGWNTEHDDVLEFLAKNIYAKIEIPGTNVYEITNVEYATINESIDKENITINCNISPVLLSNIYISNNVIANNFGCINKEINATIDIGSIDEQNCLKELVSSMKEYIPKDINYDFKGASDNEGSYMNPKYKVFTTLENENLYNSDMLVKNWNNVHKVLETFVGDKLKYDPDKDIFFRIIPPNSVGEFSHFGIGTAHGDGCFCENGEHTILQLGVYNNIFEEDVDLNNTSVNKYHSINFMKND